jgi:hypothetical protein
VHRPREARDAVHQAAEGLVVCYVVLVMLLVSVVGVVVVLCVWRVVGLVFW